MAALPFQAQANYGTWSIDFRITLLVDLIFDPDEKLIHLQVILTYSMQIYTIEMINIDRQLIPSFWSQ